jgi:hypothetical protein
MMYAYTLITNAADKPLSKSFSLDFDDSLVKKTAAKLFNGHAERQEVTGPAEFAEQIATHEPHQARTYGITEESAAEIITQKELRRLTGQHGKIARDRKSFQFSPKPGILFIDHDPAPGTEPLSPDDIRERLIAACPALADAPMVAQASSSSFIYNTDIELQGAKGWHLYVFVQDGSDIPRAGAALYEKLWLLDHGHYAVSSAGSLLDRNLIDNAVWQPERLDFTGAHCAAPLEQRRPAPQVWNADGLPLDTRLIADPTAEEAATIAQKRGHAKSVTEPERRKARDAWVTEHVKESVARGTDPATAQRTAEYAADSHVLFGDFQWRTEDGRAVTVGEILANKKDYHGTRGEHPLEADYADKRIAYLNLFGGRPHIYSHAHGGERFYLYPQTKALRLRADIPAMADEVLEHMRIAGDVYDRPDNGAQNSLVYVHKGSLIPIGPDWLRTYIARLVRCEKYDKRTKSWEPANVPLELVTAIFSNTTARGLPQLSAVINSPTMRPDGTIIDQPGYYEGDKLLFESDDLFPASIPHTPTDDEIRTATALLWRPFRDFPFVTDVDRGVMLAALLTAPVRETLPTAPGFLLDAPSAGSGKTLIMKCICRLKGITPQPAPPPPDDNEMRKTLLAELRGGARVIFLDNWVEPIRGNAAISAFLTTPRYSSRILGVSDIGAYRNCAMLLLTGNNPRVEGDATRRVLPCRLDAQMEQPSLRSFDIEPESYVRDHQPELHGAALTILRGFYSRGALKQTTDTAGSFEDWDKMVRQCVIWLGRNGFADFTIGDPYASALKNMDNDPATDTVLDVMRVMRTVLGSAYKSPKEILAALMFADDTAQDAVKAIDPKGLTAQRFGYWLTKHRDRIMDGLQIHREHYSVSKSWRYAVLETKKTKPAAATDDFADLRASANGDLL